jgi:hypothetical protein
VGAEANVTVAAAADEVAKAAEADTVAEGSTAA